MANTRRASYYAHVTPTSKRVIITRTCARACACVRALKAYNIHGAIGNDDGREDVGDYNVPFVSINAYVLSMRVRLRVRAHTHASAHTLYYLTCIAIWVSEGCIVSSRLALLSLRVIYYSPFICFRLNA